MSNVSLTATIRDTAVDSLTTLRMATQAAQTLLRSTATAVDDVGVFVTSATRMLRNNMTQYATRSDALTELRSTVDQMISLIAQVTKLLNPVVTVVNGQLVLPQPVDETTKAQYLAAIVQAKSTIGELNITIQEIEALA